MPRPLEALTTPFRRLADFVSLAWQAAASSLQRGRHWLIAPRPSLSWKTMLAKTAALRLPATYASGILVVLTGTGFVVLLVMIIPPVWRWYSCEVTVKDTITHPHAILINPVIAGIGAGLLIYAAIRQARTASKRHHEQTNADRQRRITESFSTAVEQLGSDKLEVRLGGISSLERISKESPDDYWVVMENLTTFVRESSRRNEAARRRRAYFLWQEAGRPDGQAEGFWIAARQEEIGEPATDIAAVLAVLKRRNEQSRKCEESNGWHFDLRGAHLERADLRGAHLAEADLSAAHLERADLSAAHLKAANLSGARLELAILFRADLEKADLSDAHLEEARLGGAQLQRASLTGAYLREAKLGHANLWRANLDRANLEKADLRSAGLDMAFLSGANLERATLRDARLERAGLRGAHLKRADFTRANLKGASLKNANLDGALLLRAHLEGANLLDATNLSEAQLRDAHIDAETKLSSRLEAHSSEPAPHGVH